ncbi:MAG: IdeS/Mac family cysteine endopeptidase [Bacillota bacterium]|nr:IdeS/Mac family cysteine endopeptidase [Bacillota bacterium]
MKELKKQLAIWIVFAMLLSSFPFSLSADSDIRGHWAEKNISTMKEQGLISGYGDGSFRPDKEISRAEFVAALNRMMGLTEPGSFSFSDVKESDWFAKELAIAIKFGYISGYEDGSFRPMRPVSRLEAAVMIARVNKLKERVNPSAEDLKGLKDESAIPSWARQELAAIVKSGIMKGKLNGLFSGENKITRAEAVVSLSRARELKAEFGASSETKGDEEAAKVVEKKAETKKPAPAPAPKKPAPAPRADEKDDAPAGGSGGGGGGGGAPSGDAGGSDTPSDGGSSAGGSDAAGEKPSQDGEPRVENDGAQAGEKAPAVENPAPSGESANEDGRAPNAGATPGSDDSSQGGAQAGDASGAQAGDADGAGGAADIGAAPGSEGAGPGADNGASNSGGDAGSVTPGANDAPGGQAPGSNESEGDNSQVPGGSSEAGQGPSGSDNSSQGGTQDGAQDGSQNQAPRQDTPPHNGQGEGTGQQDSAPAEKSIEELVSFLSTDQNDNVTTYKKDGKMRAILWTKGIEAPGIDETGRTGDFRKLTHNAFVDYLMNFVPNKKWYDVNKVRELDKALCSGAVGANMLHWWLEQNDDKVRAFLAKDPSNGIIGSDGGYNDLNTFLNSFKNQQKSSIFEMVTLYFGGGTGVWADHTMDLFINGYKAPNSNALNSEAKYERDRRGGFFYPVFGKTRLTDRSNSQRYHVFNERVKQWLGEGKAIAVSYEINGTGYGHIYNIWGAEFNLNGKLTAIFISDSDDYNEPELGMKRLNVKYQNEQGRVRISSDPTNPNTGALVVDLYSLSLGTEQWDRYLNGN